jgi:[FeFe] hydrogenase H-cluster maturation GTPase HydF
MKGKDLKPHIGIFGRRNNGKSTLINALTGQEVAIVSEQAGTTTDPVKKSIEIFGIGPAIITDTAGIDDEGDLGKLRVAKTIATIPNMDLAIILVANNQWGNPEISLIHKLNDHDIPFLVVYGKSDIDPITNETKVEIDKLYSGQIVEYSFFDKLSFEKIIAGLVSIRPENTYQKKSLFKGIINPKDLVLLITPIDSEAPEGRMILPQVMAWRDVLDQDAICISVKETELEDFLKLGLKPALTVTDSQVFGLVSKIIPTDWKLTSFSIVFARYRGSFDDYLVGTPHIDLLEEGDNVLLLESCTHQVSCDDIGRHKIPKWLQNYTGKNLNFDFAAGLTSFPKPIEDYALVIQCGGCVVTAKQLNSRLKPAVKKLIPVTNYGLAIAYMNGIFDRVVEPFIDANS